MPHVVCQSCRLASYAVTPHSARSLCPYCDAELFPALRPPAATATATAAAEGDAGVEAAEAA